MDPGAPDISDYSGLPGVHVTVDQLVAMNVRHWRRKARITQEELGDRIGWTSANVSAAERSAKDGNDKRRFDASTLVAIARALDIPIAAFFLPPEDDGISRRYLFHAEPGSCSSMAEMVSLLISDPSDDITPAMNAYRARYETVLTSYLDAERGEELAERLGAVSERDHAGRLARLRWQREALAAMVGDIDRMVEAFADGAGGTE